MKPFLLKAALATVSIFAPVKSIMLASMVLILCDLFTGVWAARKRGERVTSAGFQRTIVKLVVYEAAIALGFIAQHYLMADAIPVCNIIGSYVGLTELTSAYENIDSISGGKLLKTILSRLNSKNDK